MFGQWIQFIVILKSGSSNFLVDKTELTVVLRIFLLSFGSNDVYLKSIKIASKPNQCLNSLTVYG